MKYIATFPAGCFEIISRQLKKFTIDELKIKQHDGSSVTFESHLTPEKLIDLRYFTNTYVILDQARLSRYHSFIKKDVNYRLMGLTEGEPTELDARDLIRLCGLIESVFHLKPSRVGYLHDFIVMKREHSADELFTLRLPRAKHKREQIPKGALRPEVAHILLLAAGARPTDTLVDPFAGYGSIPKEAVRGFGVKGVIAIECDADLLKLMEHQPYKVYGGDATDLNMIEGGSVDRIVTDPPWGLHEGLTEADLHTLYRRSLNEMSRILKPQGIALILSSNQTLSDTIQSFPMFQLIKSYDILVSGKKATIYKLQKTAI